MRVTLGRLAYQLGMMTPDQVMKLLDTQRGSRVPLGQILASLGYLSPEKLDEELRQYLAGQRR